MRWVRLTRMIRSRLNRLRGCPLAVRMAAMRCLWNAIGRGTVCEVRAVIKAVSEKMPVSAIAAHFHNTYGLQTSERLLS